MRLHPLSQAADHLLARVEKDPCSPHYSEDSFRRKLDEAFRRTGSLPVPTGGQESLALLRSEWVDVVAEAGLTTRQMEVLAQRLEGFTFEQIGERGGHSKQGAQNIYFQAVKKLVRTWMEYPYRGLAQVYREEVRRGAPRR